MTLRLVVAALAVSLSGCGPAPMTVAPNLAAARASISSVAVIPGDVYLMPILGVPHDAAEASRISAALVPLVSEELRTRGFLVREWKSVDLAATRAALNEFALAGVAVRNLSPATRKHRDQLSRLTPGLARSADVDAIVFTRVFGHFSDTRTNGKPLAVAQPTFEIALVDGRSGEILWAGTAASRAPDAGVRAAFESLPAAPAPSAVVE